MEIDPALIIFVRNPALGVGKTRIAAQTSDEKALQIYVELLRLTHHTALDFPGKKYVFYSSFVDEEDIWSKGGFIKRKQVEGDLGKKIIDAIDHVSQLHDKILIIGSDCPYIRGMDFRSSLELLNQHDVVVGPAEDGGYYLLGLKEADHAIFQGIDWSTDRVLKQTLNSVTSLNRSYALLRTLNDIDTIEDWIKYESIVQKS